METLLKELTKCPQALLALLVAGSTIFLLFLRKKFRGEIAWIPKVPGVGVLETIGGFAGSKTPFFLQSLSQRCGRMNYRLNVPLNLWNGGVYVVGHGPSAREILTDPTTDKSPQVGAAFNKFYEGRKSMFTDSNKSKYMKSLRKGTILAFSKSQVGRMMQVARRQVKELMGRLEDYADDGEEESFDPSYEMNRLTFRVICEAAFEYTDFDESEYKTFVENVQVGVQELIIKQAVDPIRATVGKYIMPSVKHAHRCANQTREFSRKVLHAYHANPNKSSDPTVIQLINDNPAVANDEEQKLVELTNWLMAGHDTTGSTLTNMLVLLAKNPNCQDKLRQACREHKTDDPHTCDYFQWFVKESMRIVFTAALGFVRIAGRDFCTPDGKIPKGAQVFVTPLIGSLHPTIFENPHEFRPERWENPTKEMLAQWIPFSCGMRNCSGQALAMAEIQSTIPLLLEKFRFELVDEGELCCFVTLSFVGSKLKVTKI